MKRKLTLIGILIVLAFSLAISVGCAKKAVIKDGAAQDQQVASDQAAKDADAVAEAEAYRKEREREMAERDATMKAKEQETKVQAAAPPKAAPVVKKEEPLQNIYFDFDKSNIRPDARETLKANADYVLKNNVTSVVVQGHCDERGTAEYNMALGERRAREAKKYLVNLGVKDSIMSTISFGKWKPINLGSNEDAWAKNRRVQFVSAKPK